MTKYFIIGEVGESELWLIDIENRTVTSVSEAELGNSADSDTLQVIEVARTSGFIATKGVNIAIVSGSRTGAKAQSYSESDQK